MKFFIVSLLHSPFSPILGPNIRLSVRFSNTLSLYSPLNVRDNVSQPLWSHYQYSKVSVECFFLSISTTDHRESVAANQLPASLPFVRRQK